MSAPLDGFREHLAQGSAPRTALAYVRDVREFEGFRQERPAARADSLSALITFAHVDQQPVLD